MERDYEYVGYGTYSWDSDKFFKDLEKYVGKSSLGVKKFTMKLKKDIWFNFNEVYNLQTQRMWAKGIKDTDSTDARLENFADDFDFYFEKFNGKKWNDFDFYSQEDGLALSYNITDAYEEFLNEKMGNKTEPVSTEVKRNHNGEISW